MNPPREQATWKGWPLWVHGRSDETHLGLTTADALLCGRRDEGPSHWKDRRRYPVEVSDVKLTGRPTCGTCRRIAAKRSAPLFEGAA